MRKPEPVSLVGSVLTGVRTGTLGVPSDIHRCRKSDLFVSRLWYTRHTPGQKNSAIQAVTRAVPRRAGPLSGLSRLIFLFSRPSPFGSMCETPSPTNTETIVPPSSPNAKLQKERLFAPGIRIRACHRSGTCNDHSHLTLD